MWFVVCGARVSVVCGARVSVVCGSRMNGVCRVSFRGGGGGHLPPLARVSSPLGN